MKDLTAEVKRRFNVLTANHLSYISSFTVQNLSKPPLKMENSANVPFRGCALSKDEPFAHGFSLQQTQLEGRDHMGTCPLIGYNYES